MDEFARPFGIIGQAADITARGCPRAAITFYARQLHLVCASQACDCFFHLQPGGCADADGLRFFKIGQEGFVAAFIAEDKGLAFAYTVNDRGALLLMSIFANDGWEASYFHIALIKELFEQFLILLASRAGILSS